MIFKLKIGVDRLVLPILIVSFSAVSFLACLFVMYQFGGYDLSPLVDLTWRFKSGQIPGQDYFNTWPILILAISKMLSFSDSFNWQYLTYANILICFLVLASSIVLLKKHNAKYRTWITFYIFTATATPIIYSNHIWHSSISQVIFRSLPRLLQTQLKFMEWVSWQEKMQLNAC